MYNADECRKLGRIIQVERQRQGISQEELANLLGIARVTVTHMEIHGRGLDNVFTRRQVAKALGISPAMLGVLSADQMTPQVLYDTHILRKTFDLHFEQYLTTGAVGLPDVDEMVHSIFSISKSLDHKDVDVLRVLHCYSWLGIDLAGEAMDNVAADKYIGWSGKLAKEIGDPVLMARTLIAASFAMYDLGKLDRAAEYAQRAMKLENKIPSLVYATAQMNAGTASNNPKIIDTATTVVQRNPKEGDIYLRTTTDLLQIRKAMALVGSENAQEAEDIISRAEDITPATMLRRQCLIRWIRSQIAMKQRAFDQAAVSTLNAIPLAKQIKSAPNIQRLKTVHAGLLGSSYAKSQDVRLIGQAL